MNKRDTSADQPLTGLPSPHSPRDLDLRILRYARDQAPARVRRGPSRWAAGLAFTSVTGLALLLVLPTQPPTTGPIEETAEMHEHQRPAGAAATLRAPDPYPAGKTAAPGLPAFMTHAAGESGELAPETPAADAPAPETSRRAAASAGQRDQSAIGPRIEEAAVAAPGPALGAALENLADMLARGERDAANEAYQTLRRECPSCELPPTLEQAIADRLPARTNLPRP